MALAKTLGRNIRHLRQERGLSQEDFAHLADMHVTYLRGVEGGRRNPTLKIIERVAKALGVEPSSLLEAPKRQQ